MTQQTSAFDRATALVPVEGGFTMDVDPGWGIGDRANGGYLMAALARAAVVTGGHPHPVALSAHFLRPPTPGAALLRTELLRSGRTVSAVRVALVEDGASVVEALVSVGTLAEEPYWTDLVAPELPPVEQCEHQRPELAPGMRVGLLDHLDMGMDPATSGWMHGRPSGRLEMRGWARARDGREPDPLFVLQVADALPPCSFNLGLTGWAPTVEMSVLLRGLPAPGWLRCVVRGHAVAGGFFDEEAEVWDSAGRLVAQARQLAGVRVPPPSA